MKMTPPSRPSTTSPGMTNAPPTRIGTLMPIIVELSRAPALALPMWCDGS
jgi:hypothetical protein